MGCDIHMVLERRFGGQWVGVHGFEYSLDYVLDDKGNLKKRVLGGWMVRSRNYELFASLAGVRGDGPAPRGVPDDISDLARMELSDWGEDAHSETWYPLAEAVPIFAAHLMPGVLLTEQRHDLAYMLFSVNAEIRDYRLIIWFDN